MNIHIPYDLRIPLLGLNLVELYVNIDPNKFIRMSRDAFIAIPSNGYKIQYLSFWYLKVSFLVYFTHYNNILKERKTNKTTAR